VADLKDELDKKLHAITLEHLAKLAEYIPGQVKKRGTRDKLLLAYQEDPVFSIFGLDSLEYLGATLAGGTVTSIHRKIGDIYEACVKTIFMDRLKQGPTDITYSTPIQSGNTVEDRSADVCLLFEKIGTEAKQRILEYATAEVKKLTSTPNINLIGVGMEVRHCYQTGDSKRTQADEAMARHLMLSGILPIMPLFCNQSNSGIVARYRGVWVIKQGHEAYETVRILSGFDFYDFLKRNRDEFRKPVIELLKGLTP
jgi:hypothetical protein